MNTRKVLMLKDTVLFAAANYVAQGIGILNSFLLRNFMGPAGMGVWSVIQVILGYCGYASLGTTRALARDYPVLRGQKNFGQADRIKDSTLTFSLVMSIVPAVLLLGFVAIQYRKLEKAFLVGLLFLSGFLFVQRFYDFLLTLLRSEKKFRILSEQIVVNAAGGLLITVLVVRPWGIYGLYAGTALFTVCLIVFINRRNPYRFRLSWDKQVLTHELKLGLPLVLSTFLYTFLLGLDKLLLAKKMGFLGVGLYSIAMMVSNCVLSLPMIFSNVLYPNLLESYGEKKGDVSQITGYLKKPIFTLSILVPFLCSLAFAFMPLLVELFLKKFVGGIGSMKIYLVGSFFLLMGQFSNNFLVTIDKYLRIVPVLVASIFINYFTNQIFLDRGFGVEGVALGTCLSFSVYGISTYFLALHAIHGTVTGIRLVVQSVLTYGTFLALIFFLDHLIVMGSSVYLALTKCFVFLLVSTPFLYYLEKREHLISTIWSIVVNRTPFGGRGYDS
ncbi:MAG: Polysaccharide biosynthesis protein [bacterium ADurb.BinA186]|nr:MAG: Polysaccharide biosynthesis protein [bacterium ADurb.BinA186]